MRFMDAIFITYMGVILIRAALNFMYSDEETESEESSESNESTFGHIFKRIKKTFNQDEEDEDKSKILSFLIEFYYEYWINEK